ncbi:UNVERIFIED_CONTAM: hypothetical protein FKN15_030839 [Acipenser sinensis]
MSGCGWDKARCLEEENEMLEAEILELEGRLESHTSPSSTSQRENILDLSAVVERLRKEKEEILSDIDARQKQLLILQEKSGHTSEQRALLELQREEIAPEVDALTAECLALQEQVGIYEEQLELMQEEHEQRVETLVAPSDGAPLVSLEFPTPDVTPTVLDIKEYYRELAENLQLEPAAITWDEETKKTKAGTELGVEERSVSDVGELKKQIAELEKELEALRQCGEALEREIEDKEVLHEEEIAHLEDCAAELQESHEVLQQEIKEQADDYEELLSEKMALDIEIVAYSVTAALEIEHGSADSQGKAFSFHSWTGYKAALHNGKGSNSVIILQSDTASLLDSYRDKDEQQTELPTGAHSLSNPVDPLCSHLHSTL